MNNDENTYVVYKHTTPSNKVYIGITRQKPEKRWKYGDGYKRGRNTHFENAIKKYGWKNIKHEILLDGLSEEEAKEKEVELIALYDSTNRDKGYNISPGGNAVSKNSIKKSIETRRKNGTFDRERIRMASMWNDPEKRKQRVANMQNKTRTEEQKKHYKEAVIKRYKENPMSDDTRKKISEKLKGKTGAKSSRAKRVYQINPKDGSVIKTFDTARQAAIEIGTKSISAVSNACRGDNGCNQLCYGYYWCYENDYDSFSKRTEFGRDLYANGTIRKSPRVMCIETGTIYDNLTEAAKEIGIKDEGQISKQIYGNGRKTVGGYTWRFVDENGKAIDWEKPIGRPCPEKTKKAISKARSKPVMCIETGDVYKSITEAAKANGLKGCETISRQINGKLKQACGYTWKYADV